MTPEPKPLVAPHALDAEAEADFLYLPDWDLFRIPTGGPVPARASNFNAWLLVATRNLRFQMSGAAIWEDLVGAGHIPFALGGTGLTWTIGPNLTQPLASGDVFVSGGRRVELSSPILVNLNEGTHTFPASTRVWVYSSRRILDQLTQIGMTPSPAADFDLFFDDVGAGNPPNPPPGYVVVGGVDTDGTGVTANLFPLVPAPFTVETEVQVGRPWYWTDEVDRTTLSVTASNTFAPAVFVTHRPGVAGGNLLGVFPDNASSQAGLVASGSHLGPAASFAKFGGSGPSIRVDGFAAGEDSVSVFHFGGAGSYGMEIVDGAGGTPLRLDGSTQAPLELVPQGGSPGVLVDGQLWVDASEGLSYTDSGAVTRVWGSAEGRYNDSSFNPGIVTTPVAAVTVVASGAFVMREDRWYKITVRASVGFNFGNAATPIRVDVNGLPAPRAAVMQEDFGFTPVGTAEKTVTFSFMYQWTNPDAVVNVEFIVDASTMGINTLTYLTREIIVEGHLDNP